LREVEEKKNLKWGDPVAVSNNENHRIQYRGKTQTWDGKGCLVKVDHKEDGDKKAFLMSMAEGSIEKNRQSLRKSGGRENSTHTGRGSSGPSKHKEKGTRNDCKIGRSKKNKRGVWDYDGWLFESIGKMKK